jgi:hypothetical protein
MEKAETKSSKLSHEHFPFHVDNLRITRSMVANMPPHWLPLLNRRPGGFFVFRIGGYFSHLSNKSEVISFISYQIPHPFLG